MRKYIPAIGKRVTLKEFSDYSTRNIQIWAHLLVLAVNGEGVEVEILNGSERTGHVLSVPLAVIALPIGWQPRYTIHAKPWAVDTVLSWFARGIVVRQSHDMSSSMPTAFQPMDNSETPHWQFPEVTDAIPAEECAKLFRVVSVETEEISLRELGRSRRVATIRAMKKDGWEVEYKPYGGGFWVRTRETVVHDWQS